MFKKKKHEINLLPETERGESFNKNQLALAAAIVLASILIISGIATFGWYQKQQIASLNRQINNLEAEGKKEVAKTAELIAQTKIILAQYKKFSASHPNFAQKLAAFEKTVPAQVQLNDFSLNNTGKASLSGQAANPELIEAFIAALRADDENIQEVDINSVSKSKDQYAFSVNLVFK